MTNGAESEQTFFAQRIVIRPSRLLLNLIASLIALVAIWPLVILIAEAFGNLTSGSIDLGPDGLRQIAGTIKLLLGTALVGTVLGTANGWLLSNCC